MLRVGHMRDKKRNMGKSVKGSMMPGIFRVHTNWLTFSRDLTCFYINLTRSIASLKVMGYSNWTKTGVRACSSFRRRLIYSPDSPQPRGALRPDFLHDDASSRGRTYVPRLPPCTLARNGLVWSISGHNWLSDSITSQERPIRSGKNSSLRETWSSIDSLFNLIAIIITVPSKLAEELGDKKGY